MLIVSEQSQEWGDGQITSVFRMVRHKIVQMPQVIIKTSLIARWLLEFRYRFQISLYWHSLFSHYIPLTDNHFWVSSSSCTFRRPSPVIVVGVMVNYVSWFSTDLNASYCVSIIVDKKCYQFIYTVTLGSAILIPVSNLADPSTSSKKKKSLSLPFCPFAFYQRMSKTFHM